MDDQLVSDREGQSKGRRLRLHRATSGWFVQKGNESEWNARGEDNGQTVSGKRHRKES